MNIVQLSDNSDNEKLEAFGNNKKSKIEQIANFVCNNLFDGELDLGTSWKYARHFYDQGFQSVNMIRSNLKEECVQQIEWWEADLHKQIVIEKVSHGLSNKTVTTTSDELLCQIATNAISNSYCNARASTTDQKKTPSDNLLCNAKTSAIPTVETILSMGMKLNSFILDLQTDKIHAIKNCQSQIEQIAMSCQIPLKTICTKKLSHNSQKYDAASCLRTNKIQKYTEYSSATGISKSNNDNKMYLLESDFLNNNQPYPSQELDTTHLEPEIANFAFSRGWTNDKYPKLRLVSCLVSELGEFLDTIQWTHLSSTVTTLPLSQRNKLAGELADIQIYLIHYKRIYQAVK